MAQASNTIKFKSVRSDRSFLEGTLKCDDEQWSAIFAILMRKVPASLVLDVVSQPALNQGNAS